MITAAQVANATRGQLLQITYDLLLESIENIKKYARLDDSKEFAMEVQHARAILQELIDTLDFKEEIAKNLLQLYVYINGLLIKTFVSYDEALLKEATTLINNLLEGWKEATAQDRESSKVMNNAQQVYAGLTYGKSDINESVLDNSNRGFKA